MDKHRQVLEQIARMTLDGEKGWEMGIDDAFSTVHSVITMARRALQPEVVQNLLNGHQPPRPEMSGAPVQAPPLVVVSIFNGVIDDVESDFPCEVVILEQDKYLWREDYDGDKFVMVDGEFMLCREYDLPPEGVTQTLRQEIEAAKNCRRCKCGYPIANGTDLCEDCMEEAAP